MKMGIKNSMTLNNGRINFGDMIENNNHACWFEIEASTELFTGNDHDGNMNMKRRCIINEGTDSRVPRIQTTVDGWYRSVSLSLSLSLSEMWTRPPRMAVIFLQPVIR